MTWDKKFGSSDIICWSSMQSCAFPCRCSCWQISYEISRVSASSWMICQQTWWIISRILARLINHTNARRLQQTHDIFKSIWTTQKSRVCLTLRHQKLKLIFDRFQSIYFVQFTTKFNASSWFLFFVFVSIIMLATAWIYSGWWCDVALIRSRVFVTFLETMTSISFIPLLLSMPSKAEQIPAYLNSFYRRWKSNFSRLSERSFKWKFKTNCRKKGILI